MAASPLATPRLLATALRLVRASRPELRVRVRSLNATSAVAAVATGAADAALVDGIVGPNEPLHFADAGLMTATWVAQAPLVVALQAGHPLATSNHLDLENLATHRGWRRRRWSRNVPLANTVRRPGGSRCFTKAPTWAPCWNSSGPAWAPPSSPTGRWRAPAVLSGSRYAVRNWCTAPNC